MVTISALSVGFSTQKLRLLTRKKISAKKTFFLPKSSPLECRDFIPVKPKKTANKITFFKTKIGSKFKM
jgi:hypothetical protein